MLFVVCADLVERGGLRALVAEGTSLLLGSIATVTVSSISAVVEVLVRRAEEVLRVFDLKTLKCSTVVVPPN